MAVRSRRKPVVKSARIFARKFGIASGGAE